MIMFLDLVNSDKIILKIIYVLLYLPEAVLLERSLVVTTTSGPIKGKINGFNSIDYYSYQGIPYAENPTGKLRFKPPVPRKPWNNILDATEEGTVCSQLPRERATEKISEDCLNVNVYVPANETEKLLPVMVFIHGGALQYYSSNIDYCQGPQFLLEREIIFVTMNFRLGPFGFLSLDIEEASGNAGLKDILLCLEWVKRNIERFGGNPEQVTIAGHSSGSLIVNYLMLTTKSRGLFNQAILFSGSAFSPRSYVRHSKDIAITLAKELGIETDNVYEILNHLQKIDASEIIQAYNNMSKNHDSPLRLYAPFAPSKEVESDHALFTDDPIEAFRKNNKIPQKVPVLVGITAEEAISLIPYVLSKTSGIMNLRENPENFIPSNIEYPIGSQVSKNLGQMITNKYFGGEDMTRLNLTTLIQFISDTQYVFGVTYWIKRYKNMPDSNALYFYIFDFAGDLNRCNTFFKSSVNGTCHGDDLPYFLLTEATKHIIKRIDENTKRMMDTMLNFLANFIHFGNPTANNFNNVKWPDYGREQYYLLLKENPVAAMFNSSVLYARMQFWEKVYDDYYDYVDNGGEIQKKVIP